jgi:creatinine amidohydrolase/Fe(II)-dependent formamide hydrolase-like protein
VLAPTVRVGCAQQSGTLTLRAATLTSVASEIGQSLATQGFRLIALISTHGCNTLPLRLAAERLNRTVKRAFACAPEGDVGPHPGAHSGEWLTSVMLVLRPDLVQAQVATEDLAGEVHAAGREQGVIHLERFVSTIVTVIHGHQHAGR